MRIVGGKLRGRNLVAPAGGDTRPTSDRVREAVFNILAHGIAGFAIDRTRVLDLFAGTGALGLEALSRGAEFCLFVETDVEARGVVRENVEALGLTGLCRIFRRDATDLGGDGKGDFTLVLVDPPYGKGLAERALAAAATGGWLARGAIAVVEERKGSGFAWPDGFDHLDRRTWGDTEVHFARYEPT